MTTAAVIGTGFIGTVHVEAIRRIGVPVKGVLAGTADSTQTAQRKLKLEYGYSDVSEIASDSDITIVHVTSPNALHFEQVSELLELSLIHI